jgi:hypothetical protein
MAPLQSLNAELLSHDSATLTLDRWCASYQLATPDTTREPQLPEEEMHKVLKDSPQLKRKWLAHSGAIQRRMLCSID